MMTRLSRLLTACGPALADEGPGTPTCPCGWTRQPAAPSGGARAVLPGSGHLRRDLGMDDWHGTISTTNPMRLWPLAASRQDGPSGRPAPRA